MARKRFHWDGPDRPVRKVLSDGSALRAAIADACDAMRVPERQTLQRVPTSPPERRVAVTIREAGKFDRGELQRPDRAIERSYSERVRWGYHPDAVTSQISNGPKRR